MGAGRIDLAAKLLEMTSTADAAANSKVSELRGIEIADLDVPACLDQIVFE